MRAGQQRQLPAVQEVPDHAVRIEKFSVLASPAEAAETETLDRLTKIHTVGCKSASERSTLAIQC